MNYYLKIIVAILFVSAPILFIVNDRLYVPQERLWLEELYEMTNGKNWIRSDYWLSNSVPICQWYGIVCNEKQKVIEIHLNNNNLQGNLPRTFCNLKELKVLYLTHNKIKGEVPPIISQCKKLESVWLTRDKPKPKCTLLKWLEFAC